MAGVTPELCWDLRLFLPLPGLHMEHQRFISEHFKGTTGTWVGAACELQATRKLSGTCRNLTFLVRGGKEEENLP